MLRRSLLGWWFLIFASTAQAQLHLVIAETGDPAVDPVKLPASEGARFAALDDPAIGADGTVAFPATLTGVPNNTTETVWASDRLGTGARVLRLVAREGEAAPGTPAGVVFSAFAASGVVVGRDGRVAFEATLRGTGVDSGNDRGIWFETSPGTLDLVVRSGDGLLTSILDFAFTSTAAEERVAVRGNDGALRTLLGGDPQSLTVVAKQGDPVPSFDCDYAVIGRPTLNRFGQVAFDADLTVQQVGDSCERTIFRWVEGSVPLAVVSEGDVAPGFPVDTSVVPDEPSTFRLIGANPPKISDSGKVLFKIQVTVRDATPASQTEDTLWLGVPGGPLELVAVTGQTAKGGSVTIDAINDNKWAASAGGDGAATLGTDENAFPQELFLGLPLSSFSFTQVGSYGASPLLLVAERLGPTPDGSTTFDSVDAPLVNAGGQLAFNGATATSSKSLWLVEPDGGGVLVAANGEDLLLDGVPRTVSFLIDVTSAGEATGNGTSDGLPSQLSDNGQVVFRTGLQSPNGSAIIVFPEPPPAVPLARAVWVPGALLLLLAERLLRRRTGSHQDPSDAASRRPLRISSTKAS